MEEWTGELLWGSRARPNQGIVPIPRVGGPGRIYPADFRSIMDQWLVFAHYSSLFFFRGVSIVFILSLTHRCIFWEWDGVNNLSF